MAAGMNREDYFQFHQKMCKDALELSMLKNHDYSGGRDGTHPFQNFEFVESMGIGITTEQGFMVRLGDKFKRLSGFCKTGQFQVSDESFRDTCVDVINYICLLAAYMDHRKTVENKHGGSFYTDSDPGDCHQYVEDC